MKDDDFAEIFGLRMEIFDILTEFVEDTKRFERNFMIGHLQL